MINPLIRKYNHPIIRGRMDPGEELRDKRVRTFLSLLKISATKKDIYLKREREKERGVEREKKGGGKGIQGTLVCNTADERLQESVGNILGGSFLRKACRDP